MAFISDFSYTPNYSLGRAVCEVADGKHITTIKHVELKKEEDTFNGPGLKYLSIMLDVQDSNGTPYEMKIKEGDKFNEAMSRFLDCFPVVRDFYQVNTWTGAKGTCNFWHSEFNGKTYLNCIPYPEKKSNPETPIF